MGARTQRTAWRPGGAPGGGDDVAAPALPGGEGAGVVVPGVSLPSAGARPAHRPQPAGIPAPGAASLPALSLFERASQLAAVREALASARAGRGAFVALTGEAGTGKTAVLDAAASLAAGFRVAWARGSVPEQDLPFAYVEQWLGLDRRTAPHLALATGPDDEALHLIERRAALFGQARAELRRAASAGPLLVLLDDLHWADPDSLAVVGFLARRLRSLPVAVVAAMRPWPDGAATMVRHLAAEVPVASERLAPLGPEATAIMMSGILGQPLDVDVAWRAWAITKGNPLLVAHAARSVALDGGLPRPGAGSAAAMQTALLLRHLAGLPDHAVTAARAIAVVGGMAPLGVGRAVADLPAEVFADGVDILLLAGVLREAGSSRVAFSHDLLASAVYGDMAPARRRLLHERAFAALVGMADAEAAAPHAVAADLVGEPLAVAVLRDAGEAALRSGALDSGLARLRSAVDLSGAVPPASLLERYARALFVAGQPAEAVEVWRRLLGRRAPEVGRDDLLVGAAQAQAYAGDLDGALAAYDDAVAGFGRRGPLPPGLVLERCHVVWEIEGPAAALQALDVDLGPAPRSEHREQLQAARSSYRLHCGDRSGLAELARCAAAARRRLERGEPVEVASHNVLFMYAGAAAALEQFDDAAAVVDEGVGRFTSQGALWATCPLEVVRIGMLLRLGRPADALAAADAVEARGATAPLLAGYVAALRAWALSWLGRHDEADDVRQSLPPAGTRPWMVDVVAALSEAKGLLATGQAGAAADVHESVASRLERLGVAEPGLVPWAADAAESWLADGRLDRVERLVQHLQVPSAQRWPLMVATAARAGLAEARGDDEEADRLYRAAAAMAPVNPLDRAGVLVRHGSWLRRRRQPVAARALLAEALQVAEAAGAADLAVAAQAELTAAGGRRRRSGPEGLALTPQQARVARLAVSGATTREIADALRVSPRTVETHLAVVYRKLGVRSKAELRRRGVLAAEHR